MSQLDITLHHLNASRSERLFWLLEELELPYKVKVYYRLPTRSAPPELKQISPLGKAPVVVINGESFAESGAIIHHLITLAAKDNVNIEKVPSKDSIYWSHYSEGSLMTLLQMSVTIKATSGAWQGGLVGGLNDEEKAGVGKYAGWLMGGYLAPQIQTHLHEIEKFLSKSGGFFSGSSQPGEGDFMMFFPINSLLAGTRKNDGFEIGPSIHAWHKRVMDRIPAQKGMERLKREEEEQQKDEKSKI